MKNIDNTEKLIKLDLDINFEVNISEREAFTKVIEEVLNCALEEVFKRVLADSLADIIGVEVFIVNDSQIKEINNTYRNQDKSTNVISLQNFDYQELKTIKFKEISLGVIFISQDTLIKEAILYGYQNDEYLAKLIIHGFLHLVGYDHQNDIQSDKMLAMENYILKKANFNNIDGLSENYWK